MSEIGRAEPGAGAVFAEFVAELLANEDDRRESLEARGRSVITVSGALVTLLLALAGLVTKASSFKLSGAARDRVSWAVLAFVVSAVLAIATYLPQPYKVIDPLTLGGDLRARWERSADAARKAIVATRLEQLAAAQRSNGRKALCLLGSVVGQVIGIALLAWAVERALGSI